MKAATEGVTVCSA